MCFFDFYFFFFFYFPFYLRSRFSMATALRPHSRRVAEATPAAMTAAFLFEAAVCAATAGTGVGAVAGGASAAASIAGGDKGDAGNGVSAAASRKKKRPRLAPSTAALSHSLALAAGKVR